MHQERGEDGLPKDLAVQDLHNHGTRSGNIVVTCLVDGLSSNHDNVWKSLGVTILVILIQVPIAFRTVSIFSQQICLFCFQAIDIAYNKKSSCISGS